MSLSEGTTLPDGEHASVTWAISPEFVAYEDAVTFMTARAQAIAEGRQSELIWLIEHPPLYTAGTSANSSDLVWKDRFPVHKAGRGGQFTYHGPGQRVVYVMLDLRARGGDVRKFVQSLEAWVITTLHRLGISGYVRQGRIGVWVARPDKGPDVEEKIAAIGLRVKRGVSLHGFSINVTPDLSHFAGIVPCGLPHHSVTSVADLGFNATMADVDDALRTVFEEQFGPVACLGNANLTKQSTLSKQ